jgi:hypothetical protein
MRLLRFARNDKDGFRNVIARSDSDVAILLFPHRELLVVTGNLSFIKERIK